MRRNNFLFFSTIVYTVKKKKCKNRNQGHFMDFLFLCLLYHLTFTETWQFILETNFVNHRTTTLDSRLQSCCQKGKTFVNRVSTMTLMISIQVRHWTGLGVYRERFPNTTKLFQQNLLRRKCVFIWNTRLRV